MGIFRSIVICAGLSLACAGPAAAAPRPAPPMWLGAFAHAPTAYNLTPPIIVVGRDGQPHTARPGYAPLPAYPAQTTVREVVRLSAAASQIRLRFSNEFGAAPLRLGAVHVALAGDGGAILPNSDHVVTFAGQTGAIVAQGAPLLSDPLGWDVPALAKLSVSVFYPDETVPPAHTLYTLDAWSAAGDQTAMTALENEQPARSGLHLAQIDIVPVAARQTVACFGDSITEGVVSTPGAFRGWPDRLAERLQANPATRGWAVLNAGIGSNRLLHDAPSTNALARFDRDVLAVPGVTKVIVLLGINDIQYSHRNAAEAVKADAMIAALQQLIARAHAKGIAMVGGTITAFEGSPDYTPQGEAVRVKVNDWIRGGGAFDGVVDFDAATRDPARPTHLLASVESSGHLHPSDAGYAVMGDAIDLKLFPPTKKN